MRIAVTGGAGFIGSNLCNELARQGHEVTCFDNQYLGKFSNITEPIHDKCDMDVARVGDWLYAPADIKPEIVFHLAAASSSPMFNENEVSALNNNIMGFVNVMDQARKVGAKRVIYASSSSLYNDHMIPWREDLRIFPKTFYEASFKAREDIASGYLNQYGFQSIGMRFFSVYGPNERHKGKYANNITQFLWAMLQDGRPEIYGDGTQSRDFIYVDDVVRALILAMNIENPKAVFNVGTGLHTSFNEIVNKLNTGLKKDIKPVYKDNPIGKNYVSHTQADTTIAEKALGFKAQIPLDEGITKLIEAYK